MNSFLVSHHCGCLRDFKYLAEKVVNNFSVPMAIAAGNRSNCVGVCTTFLTAPKVNHHRGTPYHPQSMGQAAGTNVILINQPRPWFNKRVKFGRDPYLKVSTLALNLHRSSRLSCSPMEALFGLKPMFPMEVNALPLAINNIASRYA